MSLLALRPTAGPSVPATPGSGSRLAQAAEARPRLALLLLCLLLWLPGFFSLPPGDRDESRFAQSSRQMVDSGDYVRIHLGTQERNKKPVGIYWAQSLAVHAVEALHIGNRTEIWPYRLPSLAGALIAVLGTFQFGRGLVGRRSALLAAGLLAACTVLVTESHIAKTDAALLGTVVVSMGLMGRAYVSPGTFRPPHAALFWLALGAGILLKGPIGLMVACLTGLTLWLADRKSGGTLEWLRALRWRWGIPLLLASIAPWFIAIGVATDGRFFSQSVGGDMLSKVGSGEEAHWGPPGYYVLTFFIAAFPGAVLILPAAAAAWKRRAVPATRFLLAWAVPSWLVFEAVATKLPHYSLPMVPALMLLIGAYAMDPLQAPPRRWVRILQTVLVAVAAAALAGVATAAAWLGPREMLLLAGLAWVVAVALVVVEGRALLAGRAAKAAALGILLAIPLYAVVLQGVLPNQRMLWLSPRVAATLHRVAHGVPPQDFGIVGYHEPSMIFAVGAQTQLLRDGPAAAAFLAASPQHVVAVADRADAAFQTAASADGIAPKELAEITGFNYSRGRFVTLVFYGR